MPYWSERQTMRYYSQVLSFARRHVPDGGSVLDVGGRDCQYIAWLDWFQHKVVIDLKPPPAQPGVDTVAGDFLVWQPVAAFDLVLCLQVLEHLAEPAPFCRKLLRSGRVTIISVPYRWPKGLCSYHLQDPVNETKLQGWAGQPMLESEVVRDGKRERLVAVFGPPVL